MSVGGRGWVTSWSSLSVFNRSRRGGVRGFSTRGRLATGRSQGEGVLFLESEVLRYLGESHPMSAGHGWGALIGSVGRGVRLLTPVVSTKRKKVDKDKTASTAPSKGRKGKEGNDQEGEGNFRDHGANGLDRSTADGVGSVAKGDRAGIGSGESFV